VGVLCFTFNLIWSSMSDAHPVKFDSATKHKFVPHCTTSHSLCIIILNEKGETDDSASAIVI
jgi:hypothetical protein